MTEKLKVSCEVADVLDSLNRKDLSTDTWIRMHSEGEWVSVKNKPLNALSLEEFATALIVGYEVEMTPHEVIANEHRRTVKEAIDGRAGRFELTELGIEKRKSFVEGIEFVLDTLNIKIKGVNDK